MNLAAKLSRAPIQPRPAPAAPRPLRPAEAASEPVVAATQADQYYEIKTQLHTKLIDLLDLTLLGALPETEMRAEIVRAVEAILREDFRNAPLNQAERRALILEMQDEVLGLGPLEPFIKDPTVNDILVNTYRMIYVERSGKLQLTGARFKDDTHLRKIIERIVSRVGRRIDESSPMVDARLLDGSRVNAIIPPWPWNGPALSIRKFSKDPLEVDDLIGFGAMTPEIAKVLEGIVRGRLNIIVSGGTGSARPRF
jgi:pilus assembly protein CpaF